MSDQGRTTTAAPALVLPLGGTEPGWSPADVTPYGPGYCRYVPGKGLLKVGYESRQYRWWLQTGPAKGIPGRAGLAGPREAMRDADRLTGLRAAGMFEKLTVDELRALYRELVQAYPGYGPELASVRDDVFGQLEIAALNPAYNGPDPVLFAQAVRLAFTGAVTQALRASPNSPCRGALTGAALQAIEAGPSAGAGRLVPPGPVRHGGTAGSPRPGDAAATTAQRTRPGAGR